ncbi:MAG: copper oxidase [Chloroflexota bacterium]
MMKLKFYILLTGFGMILAACTTITPLQARESTSTNVPSTAMVSSTPTPGRMTMEDPESAHMMSPITAPNIQTASTNNDGQPLEYRMENGVKVFEITTKAVSWEILKGVTVTAFTYNGSVPGPMIRVSEGDDVKIIVKNDLPQPTTIHWHGIQVPNSMDGVPDVTQKPILPGEVFVYEFRAKPAGTFMYHSHYEGDVQVMAGLYAPFIIEPRADNLDLPDIDATLMISEWLIKDGYTYAAMPMSGMEPNYFTINGKSFPDTPTLSVKRGDRVRLRLIGIGQFIHPMHLHGVPFKIVAIDGYPIPPEMHLTRDTVSVAPGERYDIEFIADEPGKWLLHCHILHHTTNNNVEPGGLMMMIEVTE